MNQKNSVDEMAKKYKEEMMRLYSKSSSKPAQTVEKPAAKENKPQKAQMPEVHTPPQVLVPEKKPEQPVMEAAPKIVPRAAEESRFPTPEEIIAAEASKPDKTATPEFSDSRIQGEEVHMQGNYDFTPYNDTSNDELEPLYTGNSEGNAPISEMTGTGYITAEVTTGDGAVPVENAVVLITRKEGDKNVLVRMLVTDESGSTETVALPAPDIRYSEAPDPLEKPYAEYNLSAYAKGFYPVPEMTVPVFSTVKSIQPIALIPLPRFSPQNNTPRSSRAGS